MAGAPARPAVLPKIPHFGPAAQLGPQVLVSRVGELGDSVNSASARDTLTRPRGHTPRSARSGPVQLPSIEPSSVGTSQTCSAASLPYGGSAFSVSSAKGSCKSARGALPRSFADAEKAPASSTGLIALLYKSDHTHRFQGIISEDAESACGEAPPQRGPPAEGLGALLGAAGPPGGARVQGESEAQPTVARMRSSAAVLKSRSHTINFNEPARQARLRGSFRREAGEIEAAFQGLFAWPGAKQPEPDDDSPRGFEELVAAFERAGLEAVRPRPRSMKHDMELCDDVEGDEDPYGKAFHREIACCMSVLNFIRWLCGLQPVELTAEKLQVADLISQVLLPRGMMLATPQATKDMNRLATVMAEAFEQQSNPVSVLHGEGSLIGAVEKSLMATHALKVPGALEGLDQGSLAQALAARSAADAQVREPKQRPRGAAPSPVREELSALALPPPLQTLRALWDLKLGSPADSAVPEAVPRRSHAIHGSLETGGQAPRPSAQLRELQRPQQRQHHSPEVRESLRAQPRRGHDPEAVDPDGGLFGLSAVWGDRHGALAFRRCLLNPSLREFGAARRHDTCVLWTGTATCAERVRATRGREVPDAVCYPPCGLLPIVLVQYAKVPWTLAPDSSRFQPTADTQVRMWRVRIERPADRDWTVERLSEVPVKAPIVDCATKGEPFCVIFWPDIPQFSSGDQFEVELSGLRGPTSDLAFFYEVRSFHQRMMDNALVAEAARIRSTFGDKSLWGEPSQLSFQAGRRSSITSQTGSPRLRRASGRTAMIVESQPLSIETISHHKTSIVTNTPDVTILLRCKQAAAMTAQLLLTHFGGEEEEVPFALQVQKLPDQYFIILLKMPMGRRHYEVRIQVSTLDTPEDMVPHPMQYTITTTDQCPSLLASMEDSNASKFGYAPVLPAAQTHGIVLLAPCKRRALIGQCYFLVYVDKRVAMKAASARVASQSVGAPPAAAAADAAGDEGAAEPPGQGSALFGQRLLPGGRGHIVGPVADFHKAVAGILQSHTQDTEGDVHLDVSIHNGECVQRLHERSDLPGYFEGIVTFSGVDATHLVRLTMRFPRIHGAEYAPRVLSEWLACRASEHLPNYF